MERIEMKKLLALVLVLVVTGLPLSAADTAGIPMLFYGEASWYGDVYHGRTTASGETYDMTMLTAAHRTLPFGTLVRVTNLENDKSVTVRINDRGPFAKERVIDVSRAAASLLDFRTKGTAKVEIRVVQLGDGKMQAATTAASAVPALTRNEDTKQRDRPRMPTRIRYILRIWDQWRGCRNTQGNRDDSDGWAEDPAKFNIKMMTTQQSNPLRLKIVIQAGAFEP